MAFERCWTCERWTTWTFWNGYRWVPRCFDCGKLYGRVRADRKKGGDKNELDVDLQQKSDPNS